MQTHAPRPIASSSLATFVGSFVLFATHRAMTWDHLDDAAPLSGLAALKAVATGLMSDLWVAAICSSLVTIAALVLQRGGRRPGPWLAANMVAVLAILAAAHQSYVTFFHFQILPFHLPYLTDPSFLSANGTALGEPRVFATAAIGMLLAIATFFAARRSWPWARTLLAVLIALGLVAHNRNIKYRVQWFVPENLQAHPIERLYLSFKTLKPIEPLTPYQVGRLAEAFGNAVPAMPLTRTTLTELLTKPAGAPTPGFETALRDVFAARRAAGTKPLFIVLLMESMRPSETGWFAPNGSTPSFTPQLDQLARSGVVFSRAFSTGSVTRAGQEAIFCGYRSSRDLSLMRHPAHPTYECLPQALADQAETLWLHGGDGRFDGQLGFWQHAGVKQTMTATDFPAGADRTGWGVGDLTFLRHAVTRLAEARKTTASPQLVAMLLTVSHHVPWDLPGDAPSTLNAITASHPSYRTTAYADLALGAFVERLKETGLWDDTVLVVAGDHGNRIPPALSLYQGDVMQAMLQGHVDMVLSGGLVTATLAETQVTPPIVVDWPVSHTDVTVLGARLTGAESFASMSEGLFVRDRRMPVLAMLEDVLFEPATGRQWRQQELKRRLPDEFILPLYLQHALMQLASTANP